MVSDECHRQQPYALVLPQLLNRSSRILDQSDRLLSNRHFVEHKYHDHCNDPFADSGKKNRPSVDSGKSISPSQQRGIIASLSFPELLYSMLVASERDGYEDIVSWKPHGRCFITSKNAVFLDEIVPRFFNQTKLTSFQRQLNLYGFIRLTAGKDRGGYYHEYFIRGRPDLCRFIVRTRIKGTGLKAASSPETEPDFYAMEPCFSRVHGFQSDEEEKRESAERPRNLENLKSLLPPAVSNRKERSSLPPFLGESECEMYPLGFFALLGFGQQSPMDVKSEVVYAPTIELASYPTENNHGEPSSVDQLVAQQQHASSPLSSGDTLYFEGLRFHYLDHTAELLEQVL